MGISGGGGEGGSVGETAVGGQGSEEREVLSSAVQPIKATIGSGDRTVVEGIKEILGEGKEGGFVDGTTVEEITGEWLIWMLDLERLLIRVRLLVMEGGGTEGLRSNTLST